MDVLHHFRLNGIHAVGTIRLNSFRGCLLLWFTVVKAILEKWLWNGSIIAWLILHQTLLELSKLGSWKDGVERRRWEKTFHHLKLLSNTTESWKCLPGEHVAIIISNSVQDKALIPKDILFKILYSIFFTLILYFNLELSMI